MPCKEHATLLEKYQEAVRSYSEAVRRMRDYGAALPLVEFELLWELAVRANEACRDARGAMDHHLGEHGC